MSERHTNTNEVPDWMIWEHCDLWLRACGVSTEAGGDGITWSAFHTKDGAITDRFPVASDFVTRAEAEAFAYGYMVGAGENR